MHGTTLKRFLLLIYFISLIASRQAAAQAGKLDSTFGVGGIVTTDFGDQSNSNVATANAVTIQPDGKIVVCGGVPSKSGFPDAAVARYNTNGSLDSSFGTGGIAVIGSEEDVPLTGITLQSDGKIVATGENVVVRYLSNGVLDSTFGSGGIVSLGNDFIGTPITGVAIQSDGKIVVADRYLLRFLSNGQFDSTFGSGGTAKVAGDQATGLALLPSGKILVSSFLTAGQQSGFITQYDSSGNLDATFGINGQLATAGPADGMVVLSSGEFLSGGTLVNTVSGQPITNGATFGFAVSRYMGVGVTDANFGTNGGTVTPIPNFPNIATSGLAVQPSGDIVTLGTASGSRITAFGLARYTTTGQLDTTFGTNGTVATLFGLSIVTANGLAIQSDGKIVAVGSYTQTVPHGLFDTGFKVVRYLGQ